MANDIELDKNMRLNPYQRDKYKIGVGKDHWEHMMLKADATYEDFINHVFGAQAIHRLPGFTPEVSKGKAKQPARGNPILAEVITSRWVAKCECGGAEVVDPDDPRFYCFNCLNKTNAHYPRPVTFPAEAHEIEVELKKRDDPYTRNWLQHETVKDLKDENKAHGLKE